MLIADYPIIGKHLDRDFVNDIFKEIENTKIPYMSNETIRLIKKYRRKDSKLNDVKSLWKSLLIDAISILKINDAREKIYDELSNGKILTREKFDKIRKISSYGIDELGNYLDDFIDFESVLYGTEKHYRDHVNHVFQVWAIGLPTIEKNIRLNDDFSIDYKFNFHFEITKNKNLKISESELWAMWIIIALCHDLGYPIEKSSKINKQTKKIISHFGSIQFTELDYNFSILNTFLVEKFLDIISSKVYRRETTESIEARNHTENEKPNAEEMTTKKNVIEKAHPNFACTTFIQTKYRDKLSKSLEEYKHGIFSSLLLFKNLTYFLETDYYVGNEELKAEDARQFYIRKEILRSIAGHTCPKMYHIELNTLGFLLVLCDELQEWNRPNFEALVTISQENEPDVKILNLHFEEDKQIIHIEMRYITEDKPSSYEEYLIRSKFKNIHYLLRSAVNDIKRKITFQWDMYVNKSKYQFIFNSNKVSLEQLKVNKIDEKGLETNFDIYI